MSVSTFVTKYITQFISAVTQFGLNLSELSVDFLHVPSDPSRTIQTSTLFHNLLKFLTCRK